MEAEGKAIQAVRDCVVDRHEGRGYYGPRPVLQGILSLASGRELRVAVSSRQAGDEGTEWRVLALVDGAVLHVRATSDMGDWSLSSPGDGQVTIDARSYPLREVSAVGVTGWDTEDNYFGEGWGWRCSWAVWLRDGTKIDVPLFGGLPTYRELDSVEHLMRELRDALTGP